MDLDYGLVSVSRELRPKSRKIHNQGFLSVKLPVWSLRIDAKIKVKSIIYCAIIKVQLYLFEVFVANVANECPQIIGAMPSSSNRKDVPPIAVERKCHRPIKA